MSAPPLPAPVEFRYGTFLFCDMVQSTALANRIDLEELRQVFRWFREQVGVVANQHGGNIIRFVGDGAFLSFGLPQATEDATEAAVLAGLALVKAVSESEPIPGLRIALRVGIASGTVVYGDMIEGAAFKEESIVGAVAHLAARLAAAAPPDGVVISDHTRRAIGQFFECKDIGRIELKGFENGERAWQVIAQTQIASRFEAFRGHTSSNELINCVEIMAALNEAWTHALAGHGNAVILVGDPGIGKSKLARVLRARALESHATVVEIDCTPSTRNTPLFPISVLARRLAGIRAEDSDAERLRKAEALLKRVALTQDPEAALTYLEPIFGIVDTARPEGGDSAELVRERTIGLLVDMIKTAMRSGPPLFMLCEDMHWADASTILVLQRVGEALAGLPALMIATMRPGPDSVPFDLKDARRLSLAALDEKCAQDLVRLLTPAKSLSDAAVARIIERAEGVPLFLEELCRSELDAASQPIQHSAPRARPSAVPQILQGVIEARLDYAQNIKPIIQAASVIGRNFSLPLLAELLPERRSQLNDAVAWLVDSGLLTSGIDVRTGQMSFRHALIREAVYETLLLEDRERLHGQVAQLLVRHFDRLPESAPDLVAHHLIAAKRYDEAVVSLIAAGSLASGRAAYQESASHSRMALALLDKLEDTQRKHQLELQLLVQLGVAISATQGYTAPEVEATYRRAREIVHDADPAQAFGGVRGLATYYFVRNEQAMADEMSTLGLSMARSSGRIDFVIEALTVRGYTDLYTGQLDAARAALEQCLDLYREYDGSRFDYPSVQDAGTAAWSVLGMACWLRGDSLGADRSVEGAMSHIERLARPFDTAYANCFIAQQLNVQRRFADALRHATACVEMSQEHGFATWLVCGLMQQAVAAASLGPSQAAVDGLRGAMTAYLGAGAQAAIPFFCWGLARGLRNLGDDDGARAALAQGLESAKSTGETYLVAELLILSAELAASDEAALLLLEEARQVATDQGAVALALRASLTALRRRKLVSDDAERDERAWLVLEGQAPTPDDPRWAQDALAAVSRALTSSSYR
ncbi:AAA family ATPase [Variovorax dokdonensis]|uniref:AAA family ATPase n=1 Tax=Variovorax dokdonensis TaxID=344883 RepID=A0ABT7NDE0_9BURK|nr:AAA family ATPase [Variovorax dokdonensis]